MRAEIKSFCTEYDYPKDAVESLLENYDKLKVTPYFPLFKAYVDQYNEDDTSFNYSTALGGMKVISEGTGISSYTLDLLLFICFAKHCRELYEEAQLPIKFYHDSMLDLKWKLMECKKVKGEWGSFVAGWFPRFFDLSRFAIGRLQFEDDPSKDTYSKGGYTLNYGDWVINVHIPSSGKLNIDECVDSFRKAAEFYADRFPDGVAKFRCHSWLLSDLNKEYLDPNTGIRRFADLFDVVRTDPDEKGNDIWRVFGKYYEGTTEGFPAETSLQRAYIKMLNDGKFPGWGLGYIFVKDGEILR